MAAVRAHNVPISVWSRSLCLGLWHQFSRSSDLIFPASFSILPFFSKAHIKFESLKGKLGKLGLQKSSIKGSGGQ